MDHIPEDEGPEVPCAAHTVIQEDKDAGVYLVARSVAPTFHAWRRELSRSLMIALGYPAKRPHQKMTAHAQIHPF